MQGGLVRQLRGFVDEVGPEWQALPSASARTASFQTAAEALVYDALMLRVSFKQCAYSCWGQFMSPGHVKYLQHWRASAPVEAKHRCMGSVGECGHKAWHVQD